MSGTTSVPKLTFTDRGAVAPAAPDVVTGLDADFNAAFGGDLNTDPTTPQGQLITSIAAIILDKDDQLLSLFNNVDPAFASGRMQDAIARIYFLSRLPAQSTVLEILCGGAAGVIIPANSLIKDNANNLYFSTDPATIAVNGQVVVSFSAQDSGPTPIPASVQIAQAVPLWDSVSVQSGVIGNIVESRSQFEARRKLTVAANARGTLESIQAAVLKVPGVIDAYTTENFTASPVTTGGVTLAANSLYVCVAGGAQSDIAKAIWTKKPPGCNYTGNTTVTIFDDNSGYSPPLPSYAVTFQLPTAAPICFQIVISNSAQVPADALTQIQTAIANAFIGGDEGPRARIGSALYASRYYAAVASLGAWARIVDIQIGTSAIPDASFTAAIAGTALSVSAVASGTIAIGDFVYGATVAPGTRILSGSGVSWVVSVSQTVTSRAMVGVTATKNLVTIQINWIPTLQSADMMLTLV